MTTFTVPTYVFSASRRPSKAPFGESLSHFDDRAGVRACRRAGRDLPLDTLRRCERAYFEAEPLI